ncbi:hypothetical protein LJC56_05660 [Christensenellaceae bacterium OttesenSCG-928-K19]|nr:hypothetical protein [Christensenellaceae bacterium OttesenSCG-928-K19]
MKTRAKVIITIVAVLALAALAGCGTPKIDVLNPGEYDNPPGDEWADALPIYMAWDGAGGESWEYEFSAEGVVEEGGAPAPPESEDGIVLEEYDPPGGRTVWFYGVSPGDVTITFTTENSNGKVVDIQQYAVRVNDEMQLALLHQQNDNFRN